MRSFKESLSGEAAPERSGQLSSLGAEDGVAASGESVIEGVSNPVQERLAA
jgi:hypothetical protein